MDIGNQQRPDIVCGVTQTPFEFHSDGLALAGILRVPVAVLQLTSVLATNVPIWYVTFQGIIGLVQVAIGLAMLAGYRRSGVWGAF